MERWRKNPIHNVNLLCSWFLEHKIGGCHLKCSYVSLPARVCTVYIVHNGMLRNWLKSWLKLWCTTVHQRCIQDCRIQWPTSSDLRLRNKLKSAYSELTAGNPRPRPGIFIGRFSGFGSCYVVVNLPKNWFFKVFLRVLRKLLSFLICFHFLNNLFWFC